MQSRYFPNLYIAFYPFPHCRIARRNISETQQVAPHTSRPAVFAARHQSVQWLNQRRPRNIDSVCCSFVPSTPVALPRQGLLPRRANARCVLVAILVWYSWGRTGAEDVRRHIISTKDSGMGNLRTVDEENLPDGSGIADFSDVLSGAVRMSED